jgi:hypothetical protein
MPYGTTMGGKLYILVNGPNGPVRGTGFTYQYTYDVGSNGPPPFQLDLHTETNGGFGGHYAYSASPRELEILDADAETDVTFVALPD